MQRRDDRAPRRAAAKQSAAGCAAAWVLGVRVMALACCVAVAGCASVEPAAADKPHGPAPEAKKPAAVHRPAAPAKVAPSDSPPRPLIPAAEETAPGLPEGLVSATSASRALADQVGLASWYGGKFHRRRTASGELFDMRALTAAHPTLPFGSLVCVRSKVNGRTVVVRINDRGPHTGKRVIDLSRAAADALGMIGLGLKPVELFALPDGEQDCPEP